MLGIQNQIRLNLDFFRRIWILQGAMAVHGTIYHACSQIGIRAVVNLSDLSSLILQQWMHCLTECSFETADF
jgi:hypothetical protein